MPSAETIAMPSDAALVSAIRGGDQSAMATLYDRYSSIVYSVALRVLADTGAAEDVLQEVFMQLWRNPTAFDASRGSLGAWLAVITRNRSIDALRKRRSETDIDEVIVSVQPDLASEAERTRALEKVRGVLGSMNQCRLNHSVQFQLCSASQLDIRDHAVLSNRLNLQRTNRRYGGD